MGARARITRSRRHLHVMPLAAATFWISTLVTLLGWVVVPVLLGWTPYMISSGSMTPGINVGDVVVADTYDGRPLEPGTVVTYRQAGHRITHRIHEVVDGGYRTKGDANQQPDSTVLTEADIVGTGRILAPYIGRPLLWQQSGQYLPLGVFTLTTLLAGVVLVARPGVSSDIADRPHASHSRLNAGTPPPARQPVSQLGVGVVWHSRQPPPRPAAGPSDTRPTVPHRPAAAVRGLARVGSIAILVALLTVGTAAHAALVGTTAVPGQWAGHLSAPADASATAECPDATAQIRVDWTGVEDADGYDIQRTVDPDAGLETLASTEGGDTTTWQDTTVTEDQTYYYRVLATASSWQSSPSPTVSATASCSTS